MIATASSFLPTRFQRIARLPRDLNHLFAPLRERAAGVTIYTLPRGPKGADPGSVSASRTRLKNGTCSPERNRSSLARRSILQACEIPRYFHAVGWPIRAAVVEN